MKHIWLLLIFICSIVFCNDCHSQSADIDKINNKNGTYFARRYPSEVIPDDSVYILVKVFQVSLNGCVLMKKSKISLGGKEFYSDEDGRITIRISPGNHKIKSTPVLKWLWPVSTRKISFKRQTTWEFSFFHVSKDLGMH